MNIFTLEDWIVTKACPLLVAIQSHRVSQELSSDIGVDGKNPANILR